MLGTEKGHKWHKKWTSMEHTKWHRKGKMAPKLNNSFTCVYIVYISIFSIYPGKQEVWNQQGQKKTEWAAWRNLANWALDSWAPDSWAPERWAPGPNLPGTCLAHKNGTKVICRIYPEKEWNLILNSWVRKRWNGKLAKKTSHSWSSSWSNSWI